MSPRARTLAVLLVAAVGGAGTMVVELSAVRLLAPWYGTSHVVWTNVIGVVLLALALGYLIGGKLSRPGRALARMGWTLILAGATTAWLPAVSGAAAAAFLPEELRLHEASEVVLWGSLAASLLLFLPPALLLGTVAPLAVEAVQELEHGTAGHAGGAVLGASTLGSLAGVFGTSHLLLPELGIAHTFLAAALTLLAAGTAGLLLARGLRATAGIAALAWGGAALLGGEPRPALPVGTREIARAESAYQSVRVVEDERVEPRLRYLQVNEGFDSYQSVWQPELGLLPDGFYYDDFALPLGWDAGGERWRVLVLGLGGGTAIRVLEGVTPQGVELESVGIELDPVVAELAREHLDLIEGESHRVVADLDARVGLRAAGRGFDQVLLDCYANQVEIPPHLGTLELFREIREVLRPGGWLSVNLGGFGLDDPVVVAVAATAAEAFGAEVLLLRVPHARNVSLVVRRDAELPLVEAPDGRRRLRPLEGELGTLLEPRRLPGGFGVVAPGEGGPILTDDRAPLEELQRRSLREARERMRQTAGERG